MAQTTEQTAGWLRLVRASADLGLPYNVTLRKVLIGELRGRQLDGKWFVEAESVRRLRDLRDREPLPAA